MSRTSNAVSEVDFDRPFQEFVLQRRRQRAWGDCLPSPADEAKLFLQKQNIKNASLLIKGSRGLKMEKVMV